MMEARTSYPEPPKSLRATPLWAVLLFMVWAPVAAVASDVLGVWAGVLLSTAAMGIAWHSRRLDLRIITIAYMAVWVIAALDSVGMSRIHL